MVDNCSGDCSGSCANVEELVDELKTGRMIILCDDEDRENEGDLILPAQFSDTEKMAFIIKHTGGVVCVSMNNDTADRLELPNMVERNTASRGTAFTVTVDARDNVTTGISAGDRAYTSRILADRNTTPEMLTKPGHIFPLRAKKGGVLVRAGHTEGAVDYCRLSGLEQVAVISELMNDDGSMMRFPQICTFAKKHGIKVGTITDLIEYRRKNEKLIELRAKVQLPTRFGDFTLYGYKSLIDKHEHIALVKGFDRPEEHEKEKYADELILVRVHSECLTGDVLHSLRCDCGEQLDYAMQQIEDAGRGVLVYMRQEGRGIGLLHKLQAYELQEQGYDTVDANIKLGFKEDERDYGIGAQILHDLGVRKISLMSNNPKKYTALAGYGLEIVEKVRIELKPNPNNKEYMRTKKNRMGHDLKYVSDRMPAVQNDKSDNSSNQ